MTKIVINACFGRFSLSREASELLNRKLYGRGVDEVDPDYGYVDGIINRDDPALVAVIEELGPYASGRCAVLVIQEMPDGVPYTISEYDGNEVAIVDYRAVCAEAADLMRNRGGGDEAFNLLRAALDAEDT